ncbi:hypothetical protein A0H81_05140 [Grifola frondosa]|uniref:Uncharacterized protein n=1 Tax=Grifola frondosa TaxID=5627 RepID=A0A1C7MD68_GRIFR|nr:hypothetical protein A0H81_05140 [Grifola frondosa]
MPREPFANLTYIFELLFIWVHRGSDQGHTFLRKDIDSSMHRHGNLGHLSTCESSTLQDRTLSGEQILEPYKVAVTLSARNHSIVLDLDDMNSYCQVPLSQAIRSRLRGKTCAATLASTST